VAQRHPERERRICSIVKAGTSPREMHGKSAAAGNDTAAAQRSLF